MRSLLPHVRDHWRDLAATFLVATVARLLMLADPQILRMVVDRYVVRAAELPRDVFFRGVFTLVAAAVAVGLLARTFRVLQDYSIELVARRIGAKLYAQAIAHSLLLPYRAYETKRSGELLHIIQRARIDAESGISDAVRLWLAAVAILAVTAYAFTLHPLLGVMHLLGLPLVGAVMFAISTPIRRRQRQITADTAELTGTATESIRNIELLKSLGVESQEIGRIHDVNDRILGLEQQKLRLIRRFTFLEGILFHGTRAAFLGVMLWLVFHRAITTGEFLSLFLYTSMIFSPLAEAGPAVTKYQETRATFDTLDTILDIPAEERGRGGEDAGPIRSIDFDGVTLTYPGAAAPALDEIRFGVRAGETVAFTGPSGAGKSSLVKLLVALYRPTDGEVRVNGRDLRRADLDPFRARVGLVTQETHLFSGTLRENLQISRPVASDAECLVALEQAAASSIVARGTMGLDTRIGEGGMRLSGGERQRLAIARALLRDPDMLVFDEATSSLDTATERAVSDTIRGLAGARRITVIVSHRLATIAHADRIHVLDHGRISESGTHEELLAHNGRYAELWRSQTASATPI